MSNSIHGFTLSSFLEDTFDVLDIFGVLDGKSRLEIIEGQLFTPEYHSSYHYKTLACIFIRLVVVI